MDERPFVEVALEGSGSVRVEDVGQIEGTVQRVCVRDADGILRVTSWSDPGKLQRAIQEKLERVARPPPEPSPPAEGDGKAGAAAVLADFKLPTEGE